MCCFSRPVQSVRWTSIFARPAEGNRQFLVYRMTLKAKFDHALYCQGGPEEEFAVLGWEESQRPANAFMQMGKTKGLIDGERHCYKKELRGMLANQDTVLQAA